MHRMAREVSWICLLSLLLACAGEDSDAAESNGSGPGSEDATAVGAIGAQGSAGDGADEPTTAAPGAEPVMTADGNPDAPPGSRIGCSEPIATQTISAPAPSGCLDDVSAGDHKFTCGDLSFLLMVPEQCTQYACGLIVDVHGGTMSGEQMRLVTELDRLAPPCDYIVLHPSETSPLVAGFQETSQWNSDDDPKVKEFIDNTLQAFSIDRSRVHFTGFSLGGNMSWRFICNHGSLFTSVAPIAATDSCANAGLNPEFPILYMHGHTDQVVSYDSAEQMRDSVVAGLGMGAPEIIDESDGYTRTRYTNSRGTTFDFLDHIFGGQALLDGHCVPGGIDLMSGPFSTTCSTPAGMEHLHWGETVLDFFLESEGR